MRVNLLLGVGGRGQTWGYKSCIFICMNGVGPWDAQHAE